MDSCNQKESCDKSAQPTCGPEPCYPDMCNNKYIQPCRPKICKPVQQSFKNEGSISNDTAYSCSYKTFAADSKQKPIKQMNNLVMAGKFYGETVNQMSYPVHCTSKLDKFVPRSHCFVGKGPMTTETTNTHDYYIPCTDDSRQKMVPKGNLKSFENCPMTTLTTNKCSYQAVCSDRVTSYKPTQCYVAPEEKMDLNTVQRCSYKFKCPPAKMTTPWATTMAFCKPKQKMENCTVYNQSFLEPGHYVPLGSDCNRETTQVNAPRTCCPVGGLAANAELKLKSPHKKAHHF